MDTPATTEDRGRIVGGGAGRAEEAVMWWIIGFVAVCAAISIVIARRGSTGASRADDLPSSHQPGPHGGHVGGGMGGFSSGTDGGGGGQ